MRMETAGLNFDFPRRYRPLEHDTALLLDSPAEDVLHRSRLQYTDAYVGSSNQEARPKGHALRPFRCVVMFTDGL